MANLPFVVLAWIHNGCTNGCNDPKAADHNDGWLEYLPLEEAGILKDILEGAAYSSVPDRQSS